MTPLLMKVSFVVFMKVFDVYFHGLTVAYFSPFVVLLVVASDRVVWSFMAEGFATGTWVRP